MNESITELRNNGNIRITVEKYIDTEDYEEFYYRKIVRIQVRSSILGIKFWTNVKEWDTEDIDDFCVREAIELYNHIVYPYKYFITNADNT